MHKTILLAAAMVVHTGAAPSRSFVLGSEIPGPDRPMSMASHKITLSGVASGGTLIFLQTPSLNAKRYLSITTTSGASPEVIASRLAETVKALPEVFGWTESPIVAEGATLGPIPGSADGMFAFAGTETGLGIPPAPKSVTGNWHPDSGEVVLRWINPPGNYDRIGIMLNGLGYVTRGDATSYTCPGGPSPTSLSRERLRSCVVVGYRSSVPSAPAGLHVKGNVQEEAIGIPFFCGVAPNWTAWGTDEAARKLEENKRPDRMKGKLFYQRLKSKKAGEQVGAWRKFLGLTPGHTYKLSAWVCTDAMDDSQGDWSFSLHAAPDAPDGKEFALDQLAGRAPLPNGARGLQAGAFAAYRRGVTTSRKEFARASTDPEDNSPGREIGHIALPANVTSITVWARYTSSDPNACGVAFDHLRLEDLTQR